MSPSEQTNQATREEWRDLGIYYDFNETTTCWRFVGSRSGLLSFHDVLIAYANNPIHDRISEHEHYGPYFYLTIRTWSEPAITPDGIIGTLADIRQFAHLLEAKLQYTSIGERWVIDTEYANQNTAFVQCKIQEDGFDPTSADSLLQEDMA